MEFCFFKRQNIIFTSINEVLQSALSKTTSQQTSCSSLMFKNNVTITGVRKIKQIILIISSEKSFISFTKTFKHQSLNEPFKQETAHLNFSFKNESRIVATTRFSNNKALKFWFFREKIYLNNNESF